MTCVTWIIGKDGTVYFWSDKKWSSGDDVGLYRRGKIFQKWDMLIWRAGSFRTGQILEVKRQPPEREDNEWNRAYEYIVEKVVDSLYDTLAEEGLVSFGGKGKTTPRLTDSELLIGYKGRIFHVQEDFSALQREEDFNAIGSGSAAAMATLKTLKGQVFSKPKWAIKEAIHTAGTYVATVSKECTEILTLELNEQDKIEREKRMQRKRMKALKNSKKVDAWPTKEHNSDAHAQPAHDPTLVKETAVSLSEDAHAIPSGLGGTTKDTENDLNISSPAA